MGFPSAFIGGFTLTASALYLTALLHARNRRAQSQALYQQHLVLRSIVEPLPPPEPPREIERYSLVESVKDQWNREVEGLVRRCQETDWNKVGEDVVDGAARLGSRAVSAVRGAGKESK